MRVQLTHIQLTEKYTLRDLLLDEHFKIKKVQKIYNF